MKLNVRGTVIETSEATLAKIPMLKAYIDRWTHGDALPFVDISPKLFHMFLDDLSGFKCKKKYRDTIAKIADFYCVEKKAKQKSSISGITLSGYYGI